MLGLITDREQSNVDRRKELSLKGWPNMTDDEKREWTGDPKTTPGANVFPRGPYYASGVTIDYRLDHMMATAQYAGSYLFAVAIVGEAADFEGKTLTFSVGSMYSTPGATPRLAFFWHDEGGYEYAGGELASGGTLTFPVTENAQNRQYLAVYAYVATDVAVEAGAMVRYNEVMLEYGSERHAFAPYTEIITTPATKGAYNYSDLNRVETAVAELSNEYGLGLITKTDWRAWDIPKEDSLARYLSNIRAIRRFYPDQDNAPILPETMSGLTYEAANNIEKILVGVYESATKSYRSGELHSGEV